MKTAVLSRRSTHSRGPSGPPVEGVRAGVTGHEPHRDVRQEGPRWCIDTSAGTRWGRRTGFEIECEPMNSTTVELVPGERGGESVQGSAT